MFNVIAVCKTLLSSSENPDNLGNPGEPYVAPESQPVEINFEALISEYKPAALSAANFEEFLGLVNKVILEQALNPTNDLTKVAGVLNKHRIENDLEPL